MRQRARFLRAGGRFCCLLVLGSLLLALAACAPSQTPQDARLDDLGHAFTVSEPSQVAVCSGSLAEIWVLAGGQLCAVTEDGFEQHGLQLEDVPSLGSLKEPSLEALLAVEPDFVVLSANIDGHQAISQTLDELNIPNALLNVETFEDYLRVLGLFADITGREDLYRQNGLDLQSRIDEILSGVPEGAAPEVLLIRAYSSGAKAKGSDNMTGAMLKDLGCVNLADENPSVLEELSLEFILEEDPDFIFVTTMGSSDEAALEAFASSFSSNPAWASLRAVKDGRFIVLPKDLFHLKPNARWPESYEMLAELLYGQA